VSTLARRLVAEGLGTALLVAVVVGSGIHAQRLAGDSPALVLLANSLATGGGLAALLVALGPVSGGHLNPAVSLSALVQGSLSPREALAYASLQLGGGVAGVMAAHAMYGEPLLAWSTQARSGAPMWWSEFVASFGLIGVAMGTARRHPGLVPFVVASYITAGYWFTASSAFANPALTLACALTAGFSGIRAADVPAFVLAQFSGALCATLLFHWLCAHPAGKAEAAAETAAATLAATSSD